MDPSQLGSGAIISVLAVELIQIVKQSPKFKQFNYITSDANRYLGLVLAFVSSLGINVTFHDGTLIVTGLVWATILHAGLQWAQQQAYYRMFVAGGQAAQHSQSITIQQ